MTETSITRKNSSYEPTKQICKLQSLFLEGEKKVDRIRGETTILQAIKTKFDHELHFLLRWAAQEENYRRVFCPVAIHGNKFSFANFNRRASFFTTLLILIFVPHFPFKSAK